MSEMEEVRARIAARSREIARLQVEQREDIQRAINLRLSRLLAEDINRFENVGEVHTCPEDFGGVLSDRFHDDWDYV